MLIPFKSREELENEALRSGVHCSKVSRVVSRNCHYPEELNKWLYETFGIEFRNEYESFPKELTVESPSETEDWVVISKVQLDWATKTATFSQQEVDRTPYVFSTDFYKAAKWE